MPLHVRICTFLIRGFRDLPVSGGIRCYFAESLSRRRCERLNQFFFFHQTFNTIDHLKVLQHLKCLAGNFKYSKLKKNIKREEKLKEKNEEVERGQERKEEQEEKGINDEEKSGYF